MKVTIIKGPLFEERKNQAQELLYHIISQKEKPEKVKAS